MTKLFILKHFANKGKCIAKVQLHKNKKLKKMDYGFLNLDVKTTLVQKNYLMHMVDELWKLQNF